MKGTQVGLKHITSVNSRYALQVPAFEVHFDVEGLFNVRDGGLFVVYAYRVKVWRDCLVGLLFGKFP